MNTKSSPEYEKASQKMALLLFGIFLVWTPTYLFVVRPEMNEFLAQYVSSYPAILHLIPVLSPIVVLALILGRFLPPKDTPAKDSSHSK